MTFKHLVLKATGKLLRQYLSYSVLGTLKMDFSLVTSYLIRQLVLQPSPF